MNKKTILTIAFLGFLAISTQASALSIAYEPELACPLKMESRSECLKNYDEEIQKTIEDWDKQMELEVPFDGDDVPFDDYPELSDGQLPQQAFPPVDGENFPVNFDLQEDNHFETSILSEESNISTEKKGWFLSVINFLFGWL